MDMHERPGRRQRARGMLIQRSDHGRDGALITCKAWVCTSPDCGSNLRIDSGEISIGHAIGVSTK